MGDPHPDDKSDTQPRSSTSAFASIGRVFPSAVPSFLVANPLYESNDMKALMGIGNGDYKRLEGAQSGSFNKLDEALSQKLIETKEDGSQEVVVVNIQDEIGSSGQLLRRTLSDLIARDKDKEAYEHGSEDGLTDIEAGTDEASCSSEKQLGVYERIESFDFGRKGSMAVKLITGESSDDPSMDAGELSFHGKGSDWGPYSPGKKILQRNLSPVPETAQQRSNTSSPTFAAQETASSGAGAQSNASPPKTVSNEEHRADEGVVRGQNLVVQVTSCSNSPSHSAKGDEIDAAAEMGLRRRKATSPKNEHLSPKTIQSPSIIPAQSFIRLRSKSRLAEPPPPLTARQKTLLKADQASPRKSLPRSSLQAPNKLEEEDDDPLKDADLPAKYRKSKLSIWSILELCTFMVILAALLCSLLVPYFRQRVLWGLRLWRWVVLVMVVFSGRLVSSWAVRILVFLIEKNFLLRKRVLYFVYGLRKGVQTCMWLIFVLLSWCFLFDPKVEQSTQNHRALHYVTKALVCFVIAAFIWLVKTLIVKVLASSYHVSTYFDRIQESLFNQYILESLSGPALLDIQQNLEEEKHLQSKLSGLKEAGTKSTNSTDIPVRPNAVLTRSVVTGRRGQQLVPKSEGSAKDREITIQHLQKMNQKNVSAWNMKRLITVVKQTGISTLTQTLDETEDDAEDKDFDIQSEWQAKAAAKQIFKNVGKPSMKYITLDDLSRFLPYEEATNAMALFDGAKESGQISKHSLKNWVVKVYKDRRALALSLNDTRTAVNKLHRILDVLVGLLVIIIWLLVLNLATTHLLVFISSQLLLIVFIFGNTCKTIFEALIFLFAMHPFDVGDRCVVDGVQMIVEEMNILTRVFLRYDNEKIYYPNSVLSSKPISNFYRSPDMADTFEFSVHLSTPLEKIAALKEKIASYLLSKPHHWYANYTLIVKEIEDMNRMRMLLGVKHTMSHQNAPEKLMRRSDLILEMKKFFEELGIQYRLLPQDIFVHHP
ncbi:hypothetical protein O6H91_04G016800 [Diphasiastrum complanatum]|uniref:Uncharacterized protein n=1 Tax=Diphasiastrum complanatum TaxID=34168 RepID=A0ACC2DUI9_DIPCM|nr:hypothetical protein O6H91_04G016800 [Diphasiastrum complanatum]